MTEFGSSRLWKMAKLNTRRLKSWRWSRSVGEVQASQVWHQLMLKRLKWELIFGLINQGQQGFTPEYVIKNQTKPHLRNYSFLHSHFLTSSQTKLLIPWTFFNVQYIIHRGFGSLHATALASKMRQQSDWTGKNYLFNIDCRWLGPVSVYLQTRISCFTRLPIISSLFTGCS